MLKRDKISHVAKLQGALLREHRVGIPIGTQKCLPAKSQLTAKELG